MKIYFLVLPFLLGYVVAAEPTTRENLRNTTIAELKVHKKRLPEILEALSAATKTSGMRMKFTVFNGNTLTFDSIRKEVTHPTPEPVPVDDDDDFADDDDDFGSEPDLGNDDPAAQDLEKQEVIGTLSLQNVKLWDVLDYVCELFGCDYAIRPNNYILIFESEDAKEGVMPLDLRLYRLTPKQKKTFSSAQLIRTALYREGCPFDQSRYQVVKRLPSGSLLARLPTNYLHRFEKRYGLEPVSIQLARSSVVAKHPAWAFMFVPLPQISGKESDATDFLFSIKEQLKKSYPAIPPINIAVQSWIADSTLDFREVPKRVSYQDLAGMEVINIISAMSWGYKDVFYAGNHMEGRFEARIPINAAIFGKPGLEEGFEVKSWLEGFGVHLDIGRSGIAHSVKWDRTTNHLFLNVPTRDAYCILKLITLLDLDISGKSQ